MDIVKLNTDLNKLLEARTALSKMAYSDSQYDEAEEELHDQEDIFNVRYGDFLEGVIAQVHREFCPDSEVLLPTSYIPKAISQNSNGEQEFNVTDGVLVEMEDMPALEARLALLPNPPRVLLLTPGETLEAWVGKL
jgi:hypothetical protein